MEERDWSYLHVLRVCACIWVVIVHWEQRIGLPEFFHMVCSGGSWGPIIFFVLSGFLAFPSLERELKKNLERGDRRWLIKRATRLLPSYYIIVLFYFIFYTVLEEVPVDEKGIGWFRYIFLINDCVPSKDVFWTNMGAVWTISAFIFFYLFTPIYHKVIKSYYMAWGGVILMFFLAKGLAYYTTYLHTLQCFYFWGLGVLAYLSIKEHREDQLLVVGNVALLLKTVVTGTCEVGMLVMMFIVTSTKLSIRNEKIRSCIRILSQYTYSVYLTHVAVLIVLDHFYHGTKFGYTIVFFITTGLCTWLCYHLIEKKLGEKLRHIVDHRYEGGIVKK